MAKRSNGPAMDPAVSDDVSTVAKIIGTFQTSDEEEIKEKRFLAIKRNAEVLRCMAEDDDRIKNARKKLFEQTTLASESLSMAETRLELLWDHMKLMTNICTPYQISMPDRYLKHLPWKHRTEVKTRYLKQHTRTSLNLHAIPGNIPGFDTEYVPRIDIP
ncbi:hypothetical protein EJB05_23181, partial [Eragrostis curvula]